MASSNESPRDVAFYWVHLDESSNQASIKLGYFAMPLNSLPYLIEVRNLGKPFSHYGGSSKAMKKAQGHVLDNGFTIGMGVNQLIPLKPETVQEFRSNNRYYHISQLEKPNPISDNHGSNHRDITELFD